MLHAGTDEVVAVYCAPAAAVNPTDPQMYPLKEFAVESGITVRQPKQFHDPEALEIRKPHDATLMAMAYLTAFAPEAARGTPELGSIFFHPSLLPLHGKPSEGDRPIIRGPRKSGYIWHYPADGLDEGDILLQWECNFDSDDTVIDLYCKKITPLESNPFWKSATCSAAAIRRAFPKTTAMPRIRPGASHLTRRTTGRSRLVKSATSPAERTLRLERGRISRAGNSRALIH